VRYASKISACRRELSSHDAAKPREPSCPRQTCQVGNHTSLQRQPVSAAANRNDMEPLCHIEVHHCVGSYGVQSVRWAAASIAASCLGQSRRLEHAARHRRQRGAGCAWSAPQGTTRPWHARGWRASSTALPNPSLKGSTNGGPPGPVWRYAVHFRQSGPGAPPSAPP